MKNTAETNSIDSALSNLMVLDMTHAEAGPVCSMLFGHLGAEVIKIERPPSGDYSRTGALLRPGAPDKTGIPPAFMYFNNNKRSFGIDLKSEEGVSTLCKLVRQADVFIENMAPGAVDRLGLSYENLHKINPRLVYAQIKGHASSSPWAKFPALDPVGESVGGVMSLIGYEGGAPLRSGANLADSGAGLHLAVGILAALNKRSVTGRGQKVEVSMQQASMSFTRRAYSQFYEEGVSPRRLGNQALCQNIAPAGLYACADSENPDYDYCYVEVENDAQWSALSAVLGEPDLAADPRFATNASRVSNRGELDAIITAWTKTLSKHDVMERLVAAGIPASATFAPLEIVHSKNHLERGMNLAIPRLKGTEPVPVFGLPVMMSDSPACDRPTPLYNEDFDYVMKKYLGA